MFSLIFGAGLLCAALTISSCTDNATKVAKTEQQTYNDTVTGKSLKYEYEDWSARLPLKRYCRPMAKEVSICTHLIMLTGSHL